MIHKLIYLLGVKYRSPEIFQKYKFLKESESWSLKQLEDYQFIQLKRILTIAYNKSLFYRQLYDQAGIFPDGIQSLADLKKLPCISKVDFLESNKLIQNKEGYRKLFFSLTSGSTGESLTFYRNSEWDASHRAAQLRGYSWYGVNPWERNGFFSGYKMNKTKVKILDFLLNRFRLFSYNKKEIKEFSIKLKKAAYLEGYSSMIYEIAKVINQEKLGPFNLKMVKGTSEMIFDSYQEEALKAFDKKIISEYGAAETGIIAYECKHGSLHIVMENVIVEEEDGEIIVTNLVSDSFPIIRYKLGDSVILDDGVCPCGMNHRIIREVVGRVGKVIYGKEKIYPSLILNYIFKKMASKYVTLLNFQGIQRQKGLLEIHIDKKVNKVTEGHLRDECRALFSGDVEVTIYQDSLKREKDFNKKFMYFISEIDDKMGNSLRVNNLSED